MSEENQAPEAVESAPVESAPVESAPVESAPVEPAKKHDLKNTKEVLSLAFAIAKLFKEAKKNDGQIGVNDIPLMVNLFPVVGPAIEEIDLVKAELKDIDVTEVKELLVFASAHLGGSFDSEDTKVKIEKGLNAALAILEFVKVL